MHELEGVAPRQIASLDVSPSQHGLPAMSVNWQHGGHEPGQGSQLLATSVGVWQTVPHRMLGGVQPPEPDELVVDPPAPLPPIVDPPAPLPPIAAQTIVPLGLGWQREPLQHGMSVLQRPSIGTQLDDEPPVPPVAGMHMFVSGSQLKPEQQLNTAQLAPTWTQKG